jgi:hypothetical protein
MCRGRAARAAAMVAALLVATQSPHCESFAPAALSFRGAVGWDRSAVGVARRAGLEDRTEDVARVRRAANGLLGELLGAAADEARRQRDARQGARAAQQSRGGARDDGDDVVDVEARCWSEGAGSGSEAPPQGSEEDARRGDAARGLEAADDGTGSGVVSGAGAP